MKCKLRRITKYNSLKCLIRTFSLRVMFYIQTFKKVLSLIVNTGFPTNILNNAFTTISFKEPMRNNIKEVSSIILGHKFLCSIPFLRVGERMVEVV